MVSSRRRIIIDCDTGIDDAIALLLALSNPDWEVMGICAVAGNVPLGHTAPNCVRICTLAGCRIPVYAGASGPLYRKHVHAAQVHGANGIGDVELPLAYKVEKGNALDFLRQSVQAYPGEIEIITLGPMTNIAQAILLDTKFASRVKRITFMGGAVHGGNVTAAAEFNIFFDPEAARIVFQSGIPLTMVGLDVTNRALLGHDVVDRWRKSPEYAIHAAGEMLYAYRHFYDGINIPGLAMHDPLAVAAVMEPTIIDTVDLYVDVETRSDKASGKTVADEFSVTGRKPNISVAMDLDTERFLSILTQAIEGYTSVW